MRTVGSAQKDFAAKLQNCRHKGDQLRVRVVLRRVPLPLLLAPGFRTVEESPQKQKIRAIWTGSERTLGFRIRTHPCSNTYVYTHTKVKNLEMKNLGRQSVLLYVLLLSAASERDLLSL